jgi:hypothetical protein
MRKTKVLRRKRRYSRKRLRNSRKMRGGEVRLITSENDMKNYITKAQKLPPRAPVNVIEDVDGTKRYNGEYNIIDPYNYKLVKDWLNNPNVEMREAN